MWWLVYETANPVTSVQLLCRDWKGSSLWSLPIWTRGWILHEQNHQWGKSWDHHCTVVAETKMHGCRPCNCKIHKRSWGTRATNYLPDLWKKGQNAILEQKRQGPFKDQSKVSNKANSSMEKGSNLSQRPYPSSQEASKSTIKLEANWPKHLYEMWWHLSQTGISLSCLAAFNVRTVIELDISHRDVWPNQKQSTKLTFRKKLTPRMPGKPKVMQTPSTSSRYKSNSRHSRRTPKRSASACMLSGHSQPGTTTKNWTYLHAHIDPGADVNLMLVSVYKCLTGDKILQHLGPVQCTMTVYTDNTIQNLGSTPSVCEIPWQTHTEAHLQYDKPRR